LPPTIEFNVDSKMQTGASAPVLFLRATGIFITEMATRLNPSPIGRGVGVRVGVRINVDKNPDPHPPRLHARLARRHLLSTMQRMEVGHLLPMGEGKEHDFGCNQ
jgi:hypothetical protein